jgi:hypothetical protein
MDEVILVYKTDDHYSYNSRNVIGVASTAEKAIEICSEQAKKEGFKLNDEQLQNLRNIKQTQWYVGKGEFQFEAVKLDRLL